MKKINLILAHLLLIIGLITVMPATKSPTTQVYANLTFEVSEGDKGGGPDDSGKKPGSGPKEEPKDKETKSVISSIWGWIKSVVS